MQIKELKNKPDITAENIKQALAEGFESFNKEDL